MNKYVLPTNLGVILFLISCVGSYASAQPTTQSPNTMMSASSSTNMTLSQVKQAISCPTGQVCLGPIEVRGFPSPLIVPGDSLLISADVFNNSPKTISYNDICPSPLTAKFPTVPTKDKHVIVEHTVACFTIGTFSIPPGGHATVRGPPSGIVYRVVSPALPAYGLAIFTYHTDSIPGKLYRAFSFDIFP